MSSLICAKLRRRVTISTAHFRTFSGVTDPSMHGYITQYEWHKLKWETTTNQIPTVAWAVYLLLMLALPMHSGEIKYSLVNNHFYYTHKHTLTHAHACTHTHVHKYTCTHISWKSTWNLISSLIPDVHCFPTNEYRWTARQITSAMFIFALYSRQNSWALYTHRQH